MKTKLDKYFRISQRGSTIGTELIGGNVWLTHSIEAGRTVLAAEERGTKII